MCKHVQVQEYKDQTRPLIVTVTRKIKKPQFQVQKDLFAKSFEDEYINYQMLSKYNSKYQFISKLKIKI